MRSSTSKIAKSVSISEDPPTENGPCSKTDEQSAQEDDSTELRAIAARVVDDVVRLASAAAGQTDLSDEQVEGIKQALKSNRRPTPPQRLPSILIDTVPSMPPSPSEWPPPPPEDIILEEDEEDLETSEDKEASEEIHEFAAKYIQEIFQKAMELAEQKQKCADEVLIREVASQIVDDVITRANESAMDRLTADLDFPDGLPSIQIDTVASMPPSPTEDDVQFEQNTSAQPQIPEITYMLFEGDDDIQPNDEDTFKPLIKFAEAPEEVRQFVSSYVKDIVSKAIVTAEERIVAAVPFSFEDDLLKVNGPWYVRMREALLRVLRSACFCTPRRDDS